MRQRLISFSMKHSGKVIAGWENSCPQISSMLGITMVTRRATGFGRSPFHKIHVADCRVCAAERNTPFLTLSQHGALRSAARNLLCKR